MLIFCAGSIFLAGWVKTFIFQVSTFPDSLYGSSTQDQSCVLCNWWIPVEPVADSLEKSGSYAATQQCFKGSLTVFGEDALQIGGSKEIAVTVGQGCQSIGKLFDGLHGSVFIKLQLLSLDEYQSCWVRSRLVSLSDCSLPRGRHGVSFQVDNIEGEDSWCCLSIFVPCA